MPDRPSVGSQRHQELAYPEGHDYRSESPHLKHHGLFDSLVASVRGAMDDAVGRGCTRSVLDVGAGDGAFVEPMLASGCTVYAVEMSRPSIEHLEQTYGANDAFTAAFDPDGSLTAVEGRRFGVVLLASVLHHIPDYEAALERIATAHLEPGGALVSVQDPLWYARLPRGVHLTSELAFLSWRVSRGNIKRGIATRLRRLRGVYDETNPSDMTEYHVVRDGVDEEAIHRLLDPYFDRVVISPYWSTCATPWQHLGRRLGMHNTFSVVATGARR